MTLKPRCRILGTLRLLGFSIFEDSGRGVCRERGVTVDSKLNRLFSFAAVLAAVLSLLVAPVPAQQVSGSISGVVKDNQGAVVPNAKVTLVNQLQGGVREQNTNPDGSFVFTPVMPSTYTVSVESAGFKKFERRDVKLFANDRIALSDIVLDVGAVSETITVEANVVQLQTQSAERSGVVTGLQTVELALNGRNYLDLIKTVPGIVSDFNGQVAGPGGIGSIYANGQRGNQNNLTLDGVANMDTGSNGTQHTSLNIDAVAEFKVITNSQPAEFGRSAGAAINIVTKGGSKDFHGAGYWFHRNEGLNANNWRNNRDGLGRKFYRYNYQGYNIGGPIYIPGKFNKNKEKLFFFWAQEWQRQLIPNGTRQVTVPTAAERRGDFTGTHEGDGRPVTIMDPLTKQPFPGNTIPQNRWNTDGAKILSFYPLPNVTGQPGYNYQTQVSASYPRHQDMIRVDYYISDKWRLFARHIRDKDDQIMPYGQWNADYNIPFGPMHFGQPGRSSIVDLTTIINPTLTNEYIFGSSRNHLDITPVDDAFSKAKLGIQFQMPFPNADPLGLVPNFRFGGVPNAPSTGFNGTPFLNVNQTFDFTDNLSKVVGAHTVKAGFYIQRSRKDQTAFTSANGNIFFDARDPANDGDSNWAFSNALLGNFQRLQQSNIIRNGKYRYTNAEWYLQDNWKIRPNVTLDYGMRFYYIQPQYDAKLQTASFNPALWNPALAALLYQKVSVNGQNRARNPITGELAPPALVGALVPGVGKYEAGAFTDGMARAGLDGYPRGLIDTRAIHFAPRIGLAWSPGFAKSTVFRVGGGVFYDRFQGNPVFDMLPNPPSTLSPTFYYGNISTVASLPGVLFPQGVRGFSKDGHVPTTYNWNAGIQRELPFKVLLDVGYAGSVSRHLLFNYNYNMAPFGSAWLPQNQDPTAAAPRFDGTTTLPNNFYRPFIGYGDVNVYGFGANSNYNSLQVAANRRLAKSLQFGVAYTWSHALGIASGDGDTVHPLNMRLGNYGPLSFDRRHVFVANYIYEAPKGARPGTFLDNPVGRAVLNNWVVSGITTFQSGSWGGIGYGISGQGALNERTTGTPNWGPRVVLTGNPNLSKGDRSIDRFIDTTVFAPAVRPSLGLESPQRFVVGPGINNWDISVFKEFPFNQEKSRMIQLRVEMFNAWNHTQFSGFNGGVTFDTNGKVTNLPSSLGGGGGTYGFGAVNGARDPRIIQLAAKVYF